MNMNNNDSLPIVPFGKHKGKPITDLIQDTKYLEWCKKQTWFAKFPTIYNICVNQTIGSNNSDSKTPEHNKLQNLFLEKEFNIRFVNTIYRFDKLFDKLNELYETNEYKTYFADQKFNHVNYGLNDSQINCVFESSFNWDVVLVCVNDKNTINLPKIYYNKKMDIHEYILNFVQTSIQHIGCSYTARDKLCEFTFASCANTKFYIEIKTLLGDDYPAVLRKMTTQITLTKKENNIYHFILLIKEFSSHVTTKQQLEQIFRQSDIRVLFINELFDAEQFNVQLQYKLHHEQLHYDQPRYEQLHYDQPRFEQPRYEQLHYEQPRFDQPRYDQPRFEQPQFDQPQSKQQAGQSESDCSESENSQFELTPSEQFKQFRFEIYLLEKNNKMLYTQLVEAQNTIKRFAQEIELLFGLLLLCLSFLLYDFTCRM